MPATRSSSRAFRHPSSHSKSSSSHTPVEPHPTSSSSIVLNLAAPSPMPLPLRQQSSTTKKTKAKTPIPIPHEVIEISSDEDDIPRPPRPLGPSGSSTSDLRKEIRRLRDANSIHQSRLKSLQSELDIHKEKTKSLELQNQATRGDNEVVLDFSEIEDIISCNICSHAMLVPYILPGCGHTFCQKCLCEWFDTTLRNFLVVHPHYNPNNPMPGSTNLAAYLLNNPAFANHPGLINRLPPQPQYTCPECRAPVKTRPVENFVMKHFVRLTVEAKNGHPPPSPPRHRGSPWDGFFPL